jgi:RHH-type proline utilization regulon transcriptional repressor/proline dehydrogenase/delta 1-pyrroline-5-carboxylate dehydrogenase
MGTEHAMGDAMERDPDERRIAAAVALARSLVDEAARLDAAAPRRERARRARMRALVRDAGAASFTVALTDEIPRIPTDRVAARRFRHLVADAELGGLPLVDRAALTVGARLAPIAPAVVMPLVRRRLRREATGVILPAADPGFGSHVLNRRREGFRSNVNVLGEAIVGDAEARRRLDQVLARIARPDVDHVSVKLSAVCAGLSTLAFDATVARVAATLREIYHAAATSRPATFVNLDMEEYRDLDLTVAAFRAVLDEPEFEQVDAGIVLQAYLPETRAVARELGEWAARRQRVGGGRVRVRVVKGANLAMEVVEAELHGWAQAPYTCKADVDANYKAVLDVLLDPAFDAAVTVGVASHNVFDVAWALVIDAELRAAGRPSRIGIEMLEGMAPSQAIATRSAAGEVLLYTPVVAPHDFPAAIAYLVRRLDENTSADNFLAHVFDLAHDRDRFDLEATKFADAVRHRRTVADARRRAQRRPSPPTRRPVTDPFRNAPDTDWTEPSNRRWIADALAATSVPSGGRATPTVADVDAAVAVAAAAVAGWSALPADERAVLIDRVGDRFEQHRGRILATMVHETGKTVAEGDPEVSEAVDFARYDARRILALAQVEGARPAPLGVVVIAPPWNFPFAIAAGGVLAALAAGNTVILKPAPQSATTGALVAELCWAAGVPRDALQLVPAADDEAGRRLVTHPDVAAVVLTGAHATARMFLEWRPGLRLHAETSGKNAIVVTAAADVDRAVADLVRSAFGNAGQKCSAASLAIVEAPLYDDPAFLERIRDAAATLRVGDAADLATDVGPLVGPPGHALVRALTRLDPGESWLLEPECRSDDGRLWSPGIRVGVGPESWFARTECFGPVLGIVRADDLDHAIRIQNGGDLGLTAGLHSLDPDEVEHWAEQVQAGNLYVNRGITGAIVQRQPFGGWKRSTVGPTAKAGGPNQLVTLARWDDTGFDLDQIEADFARWMRDVGRVEHDATGLAAERNVLRHRPLAGGVVVRCDRALGARDRRMVEAAARATGVRLLWSDTTEETSEELAARIGTLDIDRLRLLDDEQGGDRTPLLIAAHAADVVVDTAAPVGAAEIELPRWLREQSVSITRHRHGRLVTRPI